MAIVLYTVPGICKIFVNWSVVKYQKSTFIGFIWSLNDLKNKFSTYILYLELV